MSGRNFRRLSVRYEEDGVEGLRDRRVGKLSPRRAPTRELERMALSERSSDFTVKHFHEQLVKRHDCKLCYTVTKASLQAAGLVAKAKRRGAHRKKRERRPLPGMLLFQDGSTQDVADPGRPRALPARHHPHPVLFAAGVRAPGAGVRDAAEAATAGAAPGPHQDSW
jgi:hypothetical protein